MDKKEFILEQQYLIDKYNNLKDIIKDEYEKTILPDELKPGNANNKDEIPFIIQEQEQFYNNVKYIYLRIKELENILPEIYFSRIDLKKSDGDTTSYYISKKGLSSLNTFDWRSEIGELFYNVTITKYEDSTISLKRRFDLSHDKLISYDDNFVSDKKNKELSEYSDGFLIEILKKRKNIKGIQDIIKSVQKEQNNIIRSRDDINFIVLGCAGSGKTMILLHKLSFLKFHLHKSFSKVKIFTPNERLVHNLLKLKNDLELNEVEMISITKYFKNILSDNRYINDDVKEFDEYLINGPVLEEIYSKETLDHLFTLYKNDINEIYNKFESVLFACNLSRTNNNSKSKFDQMVDNYELIFDYTKKLKEKIFNILNLINHKILIYSDSINYILKEILDKDDITSEYYKDFSYVFSNIINLGGKFKNIEKLSNLNFSAKKLKKDFNDYNVIKELNTSSYTELLNNITNCETRINEINQYNDNIKSMISSLEGEKDNLNVICSELKKINVFRKRRYNSRLSKISVELNRLTGYYDNNIHEINELKIKINELIENKILLEDKLIKIDKLCGIIQILDEEINNVSILEKLLDEVSYNFKLIDYNTQLIEEMKQILNIKRWFDNVFIDKHINIKLKNSKLAQITDAQKYSFYYMYLLYLVITYKKINIRPNELICIDEFQDISFLELELIKELNPNLRLNLYGDFKQKLLSKGFSDDKYFLNNYKIFHLNNNYRNTNQITHYYNEKINFKDRAIGVDGPEIEYITYSQFELINGIDNIIICSSKLRDKLHRSNNNVTILNVENAKGLEFNTVYVYDCEMTLPEKYIAYSRALYKLIIISD